VNRGPANGDCAAVADQLPELALGILGGTARADVLAHLDRCPACRETTAGYAATVDALPLLLGEAEPPPGFEERTLDRIKAGTPRPSTKTVVSRVLAVAAAIAAIVLVTTATVRIIDARNRDDGPMLVDRAEMIGHGTNPAGSAMWVRSDERYLWLDIDYGDRNGRYRVETLDAARDKEVVGTVQVRRGRGAWAGEVAGPRPALVRLVDDEGKVWCEARFRSVS
jgi:hypothetical protein